MRVCPRGDWRGAVVRRSTSMCMMVCEDANEVRLKEFSLQDGLGRMCRTQLPVIISINPIALYPRSPISIVAYTVVATQYGRAPRVRSVAVGSGGIVLSVRATRFIVSLRFGSHVDVLVHGSATCRQFSAVRSHHPRSSRSRLKASQRTQDCAHLSINAMAIPYLFCARAPFASPPRSPATKALQGPSPQPYFSFASPSRPATAADGAAAFAAVATVVSNAATSRTSDASEVADGAWAALASGSARPAPIGAESA